MRGLGLEERCGATWEMRSWTGRVRSLLNLRYWFADQSLDWGVGEVAVVDCEVAMVREGFSGAGLVVVAVERRRELAGLLLLLLLGVLDPKLRETPIYGVQNCSRAARCSPAHCAVRPRIASRA